MNSKEEIYSKWCEAGGRRSDILSAMQEYADQEKKKEAIAAMKWFFKNGSDYFFKQDDKWDIATAYDGITGSITDDELYKLFNKQK